MKIPATVPPLPKAVDRNRHMAASQAFTWIAEGWRDLWTIPMPSLAYGAGVALVSLAIVCSLMFYSLDFAFFPALAGFLVVGPALATGLYVKSQRLAKGLPVTFASMIVPEKGTAQHVLFVGAVLMGLMLLWMRAAVLIYALFFGWRPFPGMDHIVEMLFGTPVGIAMLVVGIIIGGVFAAFAFAVSVFSIPMVLDKRFDAFTAMGTSISIVWNNLPVMMLWGAIVLLFTLLSLATAMLGFVIVFPLLGHATWHAYVSMRDPD
ncbi:hypothetical protein CU102_15070 [Phyllobacterium brassicacearum]|uniref:DUF2189 domain-containing protein n=1 Tax=Phyllobacterium brassicacearum TaxID=314235 RepID=A0A2P7BP66_9HYPH|nr:DUF2189 domain-containing protein [Phyllobacterium brassicacearum]PSH68234.1 hypothetical protein CU102_15070 [Phyllobacterium brassicacearum]TDQ29520.1 putative membrane protein [Phyllobacterium brassicacearum]